MPLEWWFWLGDIPIAIANLQHRVMVGENAKAMERMIWWVSDIRML